MVGQNLKFSFENKNVPYINITHGVLYLDKPSLEI
jgi:hypothetical protein